MNSTFEGFAPDFELLQARTLAICPWTHQSSLASADGSNWAGRWAISSVFGSSSFIPSLGPSSARSQRATTFCVLAALRERRPRVERVHVEHMLTITCKFFFFWKRRVGVVGVAGWKVRLNLRYISSQSACMVVIQTMVNMLARANQEIFHLVVPRCIHHFWTVLYTLTAVLGCNHPARACVPACACVCKRERERESARGTETVQSVLSHK